MMSSVPVHKHIVGNLMVPAGGAKHAQVSNQELAGTNIQHFTSFAEESRDVGVDHLDCLNSQTYMVQWVG